jgi:hypothetical protein
MIDIITVSTHDAKKLVADLVRLLEAEEHRVRVISGRHAEVEIEAAKTSKDAVLIVWSEDAPSSSYMRNWLFQSDPSRLIEISIAPGAPERRDRKAPVIDFSSWRGERGGRAWNALNDRLRAVARIIEPPPPPPRHAALAMGLAGLAAVGVAMGVRSNEAPVQAPMDESQQTAVLEAPTLSVGGAVYAVEPASIEDLSAIPPLRPLRVQPLDVTPIELTEYNPAPIPEVRDPTLFERIAGFNPLRNNSDD